MEVPTITIKLKGLQAIEALGGKGGLLGGLKLPAAAAAPFRLGELEAKRAILTKNGLILQEIEGKGILGTKELGAAKAALGKGALGAKGAATAKAGAAKGALVPSTVFSAKGLGWSLGLGGFGPWLALGALCLAATGVYLYLRDVRGRDTGNAPEEVADFEPVT